MIDKTKIKSKNRRVFWSIIILALFVTLILTFSFAFLIYSYSHFFFSKAIFNVDAEGKIVDYEIVNSSLSSFLMNHPIEAFKNCKVWDSVNEEKYKYKFENGRVYFCSILKYENSQFIIEKNLDK